VTHVYSDGGRKAAGYTRRSKRGDCVVRAIAIATGQPYAMVRDALNERAQCLSCVAARYICAPRNYRRDVSYAERLGIWSR
jgi:hypothetical protein